MRTWFEPEEAEEFEAARSVLLRRCLAWAAEHGRPADGLLIASAVEARHHSHDGRIAYWDERQIRRHLLAWVPRYVVAPREVLEIAPEVLRTYLHYLAATGLRDPRGATLAEADEVIARLAPDFRRALDDPYRQGLGKFWAQTALDHGTDLADPGGVAEFERDLDAGRIRYDADVLDRLLADRHAEKGHDLEEERARPLPPIALPPARALREAAAAGPLVRQLVTLADWAGEKGRPLTAAGRLPLAAARELSALLGTGEQDLRVRSSAGLPRLSLLLAWAGRLRLIRTTGGRLYREAGSAPLLDDPWALWTRAFETLPDLIHATTTRRPAPGPDHATATRPTGPGPSQATATRPTGPGPGRASTAGRPGPLVGELLPGLLDTMYGLGDVPVRHLEETAWPACREHAAAGGEDHRRHHDLWRRAVAADLRRAFDLLADLGAVELTRGPAGERRPKALDHEDQEFPPDAIDRLRTGLAAPDLLLARLTPLALHALRTSLLARGRDAPLVGELATAPPAELLGVLSQHYPLPEAAAELNAWLSRPGQDVAALLQAVRDCPFRTRAAAMLDVLAETLPEGPALLRALRRDPVLGPTALTFLVDEGEVDPGTLGQHEHLLLAAENFLTLLELGGPQALIEQLKAMAGKEAYELAAAVLASGHHDVAGLAEMRELVAEPLRATINRPLRLIPGTGPGRRTRSTGRGRRRDR
ncbi:hypothetical protein [Nonomuraea candida]|uniref:hypothetical protein n=1 Tax=Nonomuraea candida TaxID=359159 RepID=UPI0005BD7DD6|nr:hypothetical protein [Nonomuraea candida]